jgi:hypothetical protein
VHYAFRQAKGLSNIVKQLIVKAPLAVLALALLTTLSCGKRRAPLPPQERVQQRAELAAFQRGNQVILSWRMPARNASGGSVLNIDRVDIYRLAEPLSSPQTLTEEEFASRSVLIATEKITDADFGLKTITYRDPLEFAGQPARLRYAVRFVNASGQKAAFSNFVLLEPAARVANSPTSLSADVTQESVNLRWTAPLQNVDGSTPANIVGYNLYRSPSDKDPGKLLNTSPITTTDFADRFFDFEKDFYYFVRTVSVGTGGAPIESSESNILKVAPKDTFAPSAPAAITLAATPTTISIFFPTNPETDVAGYRIYRSVDPDLAKDRWELMTLEPLTTSTFQDSRVESGKTYYYFVTAFDKYGNVSPPSAVVSETVP